MTEVWDGDGSRSSLKDCGEEKWVKEKSDLSSGTVGRIKVKRDASSR